jgi:hypothetical protein
MKPIISIIVLIILLSLIFIRCSNKDKSDNKPVIKKPELKKKEYGGCFIGQETNKSTQSDSIYYELINDTLLLHVTINKNCASMPLDSVLIYQDSVNIFIKDKFEPVAYCDCDYKFNYYFTEFSNLHKFNIYYKDYGMTNYNFWGHLIYP